MIYWVSIWEVNDMLCDNCKKNEATIHYTEIINGVKNERHLCSECMQSIGEDMEGEIPLSRLIRGILSAHLSGSQISGTNNVDIMCDKCKMTYSEFARTGKFGCSECYSVFGPLIVDNIKKIQASTRHTGKKYIRPDAGADTDYEKQTLNEAKQVIGNTADNRLMTMQRQLKEAVAAEDFEEAARLRDEIKAFKEGVGGNA